MNATIARQIINSEWFFEALCLTFCFGWVVIQGMRRKGWYNEMYNRAALAFSIYCLGETIARGWAIVLLRSLTNPNTGILLELENRFYIGFVGTTLSVIGGYCLLRIFCPPSWGNPNVVWAGCIILGSIFSIFVTFGPY